MSGWFVSESEDLNLAFEAGPDYVNVDFYDPIEDRSGIAGRWALNYDQFVFNRAVQLFHNHEGLIASDLFIRTRTGFRVPIWRGLQFTNEIQVDW